MDTTILHQEEENKKKGMIASTIIHVILIMLAIFPFLTFPDPPPEAAGVLISFGEPNAGSEDERMASSKPAEVEEVEDEPEEVVEKEVEEVKEEKPKEEKPKVKETKKVNTDDNSKEIALQKKKAKEAADKKKEADNVAKAKKEKADALAKEKKRLADIEAKKKADAAAIKDGIGDLFNNNDNDGKGTGSGSGTTPGNNGDPNADNLKDIGEGKGNVSGFGGRGFKRPGTITSNFQEVGTVSLKVCVDGNGKVISADPKLSGSTTQSSRLQNLAIQNAKKYRFDPAGVDQQCGTITYKFQLQ